MSIKIGRALTVNCRESIRELNQTIINLNSTRFPLIGTSKLEGLKRFEVPTKENNQFQITVFDMAGQVK